MPAVPLPSRAAAPAALVGGRWATILGAALLLGMALLAGTRWFGPGGPPVDPHEAVVQQPVGPDDFSSNRSELTAPDPGDDL